MTTTAWFTWTSKGRDLFTNPKSTVAHAGVQGARAEDARTGSFPLACGRWAPDGWDAEIVVAPHARRCKRCLKALEKEDRNV